MSDANVPESSKTAPTEEKPASGVANPACEPDSDQKKKEEEPVAKKESNMKNELVEAIQLIMLKYSPLAISYEIPYHGVTIQAHEHGATLINAADFTVIVIDQGYHNGLNIGNIDQCKLCGKRHIKHHL